MEIVPLVLARSACERELPSRLDTVHGGADAGSPKTLDALVQVPARVESWDLRPEVIQLAGNCDEAAIQGKAWQVMLVHPVDPCGDTAR